MTDEPRIDFSTPSIRLELDDDVRLDCADVSWQAVSNVRWWYALASRVERRRDWRFLWLRHRESVHTFWVEL